jgi:hypothetical protein
MQPDISWQETHCHSSVLVKSTPKSKDVEVIDDAGNTPHAVSACGRLKKIGPEKPPALFSVSISVIHKQYTIHQYPSMHQADTYNLAVYMDTNWSQRSRLWLTRKSGKARISCDLKSSQPLSTVVDYKAEGIAVAWVNEGKKRARRVHALGLRLSTIWKKRRT